MRTLMLDDDSIQLLVAEGCLRALGLSEIFSTTDPIEALVTLQKESIELFVVDLNMPLRDGLDILRALSETRFQGSVIIISSERAAVVNSASQIGQKLGLNIAAALPKPINLDSLKQAYEQARFATLQTRSTNPDIRLVPKGELTPLFHYQPQVDFNSGQTVGTEALLRGVDSEGNMFGPSEVLNTCKSPAASFELASRLFDLFCRDVRAFRQSGFSNTFSFNVDAQTFSSPDFFKMLTDTVRKYQVNSAGIVIELIESRLPEDEIKLLETIARLSMAQFEVALDDFGTGASSFNLLHAGAFEEIKLDMGLVHAAGEDVAAEKFVKSTVEIAQALDIRVVAEGVETNDQLLQMSQMGINIVQGYIFAKPGEKAALRNSYADQLSKMQSQFPINSAESGVA